jgi:hypothetical protein
LNASAALDRSTEDRNLGTANAASTPMITTTTANSTNVKPRLLSRIVNLPYP